MRVETLNNCSSRRTASILSFLGKLLRLHSKKNGNHGRETSHAEKCWSALISTFFQWEGAKKCCPTSASNLPIFELSTLEILQTALNFCRKSILGNLFITRFVVFGTSDDISPNFSRLPLQKKTFNSKVSKYYDSYTVNILIPRTAEWHELGKKVAQLADLGNSKHIDEIR